MKRRLPVWRSWPSPAAPAGRRRQPSAENTWALTDRLYDPEEPDHQDWFADCTPEWVEQFRPF